MNTHTDINLTVGTRVKALYPNTKWGEGIVTEINADRKLKPLVVRSDDGRIGYFHPDQVTAI